ncbi:MULTISPECIES: peptide ABC transporter substrate-binding protein [Sinorhizobium]|uniref:Peptide ABC transporter substrate-binding protein n=1 Tax=Sinorhizobium kummerowiae TaxID=158892 RepID=A0ABY8TF45_9HYPH|nr:MULTISPECIES: peptide ABC transporter substrate-binding protein [Sinorhizobium]WHS95865.1 peptide ABC transporter substrate-binding protein [Sinorhizobium kummerowiae]WQH41046.1 peptide ABC transporter substrate-binding protein [Sinorhizobium kummerowiae]
MHQASQPEVWKCTLAKKGNENMLCAINEGNNSPFSRTSAVRHGKGTGKFRHPHKWTSRVSVALLASALALSAGSLQCAFAGSQDVLRMIVAEPRFMDPNLASDTSIYVNAQLFQPLARLGDDGQLQMLQAKSIELDSDGRTWLITLNPDYKWSNGEPITAADWEYSWKRILDPKTASEVAVFLSDIEKAEAYNKGELSDASQVGIKAIDQYTLQVVTGKAAPHFRAKLGLPYLTPVPKALVEKFGDAWISTEHIVSNGPYKLVSRVNDQSIVMEANPYYGGVKPNISRVEMTVASGDLCAAQLRAYEADEIDFATCLPSQDIARIKADPDLSNELNSYSLPASEWVHFDMANPRWANKRIRHALSLAIDRKALVEASSGGGAQAAATIVPDSILRGSSEDAIRGSVKDAQKLLAEAGYPDGKGFPQITITTSSDNGRPLIAQVLQQMWSENLGIESSIDVLEENAYRAWVQSRKTDGYEMAISGWWSDYADPMNWFGDLIISDFRQNHFSNADFAALVEKANTEVNPAKRSEAFRLANKKLEDEQPMIAINHPTSLWMVKPRIDGLKHEGTLDMYHLEEATSR